MKLKDYIATWLCRLANKLSASGPWAPDNCNAETLLTSISCTPQRIMMENRMVVPNNPQEFPSEYLTEVVPKELARDIGEKMLQCGFITIKKQSEPGQREQRMITYRAEALVIHPITSDT